MIDHGSEASRYRGGKFLEEADAKVRIRKDKNFQGKKTQREREVKAAERIFGVLPDDQKDKFSALWDEFEAGETPEAKFAHTMDNFQPAMLNNATDGKMWKSHKVKLQQILERNSNSADGSGHDS